MRFRLLQAHGYLKRLYKRSLNCYKAHRHFATRMRTLRLHLDTDCQACLLVMTLASWHMVEVCSVIQCTKSDRYRLETYHRLIYVRMHSPCSEIVTNRRVEQGMSRGLRS